MDAIRIVIADDQLITRSGLQALLAAQDDLEVVGEARDGEEAIQLAASLQLDVMLMDLRMPGIHGIEVTRRIHRASPHINILVLTVFKEIRRYFPPYGRGRAGICSRTSSKTSCCGPSMPWPWAGHRAESAGVSFGSAP